MTGSVTAGVQAVQDITYAQVTVDFITYNSLLHWTSVPDSDPASHQCTTHGSSAGGILIIDQRIYKILNP